MVFRQQDSCCLTQCAIAAVLQSLAACPAELAVPVVFVVEVELGMLFQQSDSSSAVYMHTVEATER